MYASNNYFYPIAAAAQFQPPIVLPADGLLPNNESLNFLNEQMLLTETKTLDTYTLDERPNQQIKQMCAVIEKHGNLEERLKFLNKLESTRCHSQTDPVLKLKCKILFDQLQFNVLYNIIETHPFAREYHLELQGLWNDAHYKEAESQRGGRNLDPVTRYRVRRKNTFPRTIWDGEGTSYCFKKRDRKILKEAYERNPMPTQQEKQALSQKTELNVTQVSNWFKNQRQRARQHKRERCAKAYSNSISDDYIESEREDSGRSGNSGSRGSNPISEEDDHPISNMAANIHSFNLMNTQLPAHQPLQPTTSTALTGISPVGSCLSDLTQLNASTATATTPSFYNNFNIAPHFENYWSSSTNPAVVNGFSAAAAQMYYPLGMYPYTASTPTYSAPNVYQPVTSQYFKFFNPDPLSSVTANSALNSQALSVQQNENTQYPFGINATTTPTDLKYPKYEPSNSDYQSL
ncbi:Sine oculis-like transcription factor Six1/2 [Aphelenchoides bicaudatus]|nr:Sine oculis-like transcription factor Six1/2 [Aphelenchoides bicaudatus]